MSIGKKKEITIATCDGDTIIVCDDACVWHANKLIGLFTQESHIILLGTMRCLGHMLMVTYVESKWP